MLHTTAKTLTAGVRPLALLVFLLLGACSTQQSQIVYTGTPLPEPVEAPPQEDTGAAEFARSMLLADMLYAAAVAFEDNRLTSPAHDNAYDRYQEVLRLDPTNAVALQGLRDIVQRYIELGDAATAVGRFSEAEGLLGRAAKLDPAHAGLAAARERLRVARQTELDRIALDPDGIRSRSLETMTQLAEIAQQIMRSEATFLINARSDEEGRWIYKVMREAVGGYRLRGNIATSGTPYISITRPLDAACTSTC